LGCVAGFYGGFLDRFLLSAITIIQAFPGILLVIAVAAFLETSFLSILFALTVSSWIGLQGLQEVKLCL
jgi:ABC-type dipeptide/oligopeptide/nickel transport system permease subunit